MILSKRFVIVLGASLACGVAAAGAYFFVVQDDGDIPREVQMRRAAEVIVEACADSDYRPTCYDEEIPKVMDNGYSMEEAFAITRLVQDADPEYQYCHILGHELSAKETAKDPSRWKDVVARAPLGVCSNGAIHGAFQERFRVESMEGHSVAEIEPELQGVCDPRDGWEVTEMGKATCIHALGHLTMYVTGADIHDSLELCDRLVPANKYDSERQLCYDGAFMQIYQPLEPEDFALIAGMEIESREESIAFCEQFSGAKRGSCISESWPLYRDTFDSPETITQLCERTNYDDWQYERCLNGLFFVAMAQSNLSNEWALSFCPNLPASYSGTCIGNAAARLIETDDRNIGRALALCTDAEASGLGGACFNDLLKYSNYIFTIGSPEFYELCNGMPDPWKTDCLAQVPQV